MFDVKKPEPVSQATGQPRPRHEDEDAHFAEGFENFETQTLRVSRAPDPD